MKVTAPFRHMIERQRRSPVTQEDIATPPAAKVAAESTPTDEEHPPYSHINKRVGGAALQEYVSANNFVREDFKNETFSHLFPAAFLVERGYGNDVTHEEAERLINNLDPTSPYHDFAIGELALYHLKKGDVTFAHDSVALLKDDTLKVHVLSQIVMYEDEQKMRTLDEKEISETLHHLAIDTYDKTNDTFAATALIEASEALYSDKELRTYARIVLLEHPEVPQAVAAASQDMTLI